MYINHNLFGSKPLMMDYFPLLTLLRVLKRRSKRREVKSKIKVKN